MIVDITAAQVGDKAKVKSQAPGHWWYGVLTAEIGTPLHGVSPILELTTPAGTKIRAGRCWVEKITTEEDMMRLRGHASRTHRLRITKTAASLAPRGAG